METRETITLDSRGQQRLYVLNHVLAGGLTADEASRVLHCSEQTIRRLLATYRADGAAGLVHGNRGRSPAHRTPDGIRDRLIQLASATYAGVNRAHLAELLAEREGLVVAERTLRRILAEAGLVPPSCQTRFPRDPADRIIFATAVEHGLRLGTRDRRPHAADQAGAVVVW